MHFRAYFILYRGRIITACVASFLLAFLITSIAISDNPLDLRAFWNHFCGCPPAASDVRAFLDSFAIISLVMGYTLGVVTGISLGAQPNAARAASPVAIGDTRFQLTRPVPRTRLMLPPLLIAGGIMAVVPPLCYLLLLGWLKMVHAPTLPHIVADAELVPAVAALGLHPSFLGIVKAMQLVRHCLAGFSVGLCIYALASSTRWFALSSYISLRRATVFVALIPLLFPLTIMTHSSWIAPVLMIPGSGVSLNYAPSMLNVALHLGFAAAVILGARYVVQEADV